MKQPIGRQIAVSGTRRLFDLGTKGCLFRNQVYGNLDTVNEGTSQLDECTDCICKVSLESKRHMAKNRPHNKHFVRRCLHMCTKPRTTTPGTFYVSFHVTTTAAAFVGPIFFHFRSFLWSIQLFRDSANTHDVKQPHISSSEASLPICTSI